MTWYGYSLAVNDVDMCFLWNQFILTVEIADLKAKIYVSDKEKTGKITLFLCVPSALPI